MSERCAFFIGRFQPLHEGHIALINVALSEGKPVVVALMDTPQDDANPYSIQERQQMFWEAFGNRVRVMAIPPVAEVCYGRNVGYRIRHIRLPAEVEAITATGIRKEGA